MVKSDPSELIKDTGWLEYGEGKEYDDLNLGTYFESPLVYVRFWENRKGHSFYDALTKEDFIKITWSDFYKVVGKFDKDTKIIVDRDYIDISNIEYKIIEFDEKETCVKLTSKGLKQLKKQVREFIYNFIVDDLDNCLYFGIAEDLEPQAYKQILKEVC